MRCVRNTSTPTSIKGTDLGERIRIYPNPAASCFRVDISPEIELTELELSDLQGKLVQSIHASNEKEILIDVSTVKSGTYLLTIHSTEGSDSRTIIVK
ncbi:MAG: T9SS type A sorting domain-containing protein [Flavobacteriales bacterium]|nr:T9SS type A sorting domain-containing protein [Flavobacteriales bacterium]